MQYELNKHAHKMPAFAARIKIFSSISALELERKKSYKQTAECVTQMTDQASAPQADRKGYSF